jgi:hypothetical protein
MLVLFEKGPSRERIVEREGRINQVRLTQCLNSRTANADDWQTVSGRNFAAASGHLLAGADSGRCRLSPVTAGTAAGSAALTVGRGVLSAAASGLSFVAELAKAAGGSTADEAKNTAATASHAFTNLVTELQRRIQQCLAQQGVHLSKPVELASDGAGGIVVAAPHPEQVAIEAAIASDFLLERDFQRLAEDATVGPSAFTLVVDPGR